MAVKTLDEAVKAINDAIEEAERISEETGESFSICPAYGMGGSYNPYSSRGKEEPEEGEGDWEESWEESYDEDEYGWMPSSQSC